MSRIKEILGFDRFRITDLMFLGFFIAMIFKINYVYQEIFIIRYKALVITLTVTIITLITHVTFSPFFFISRNSKRPFFFAMTFIPPVLDFRQFTY